MHARKLLLTLALTAVSAFAADINGKWTGTFETQVGTQNYTIDLKMEGGKITGHAASEMGEGPIVEGKSEGDNVSFVEVRKIQDMEIRVEYSGKINGDQMKLTRKVGDFGSSDVVINRSK